MNIGVSIVRARYGNKGTVREQVRMVGGRTG